MPERNPTAKPLFFAGTTIESGVPNTGQQMFSFGGTRNYTKLSGVAGGDTNIWVGGGRLDSVYMIPSADPIASGKPILFYDSAAAVSGGPLSTSGHKVVGGVQFINIGTNLSGVINYGGFQQVGFVFTSGLCHTGASGQVGFSVSFTPTISG